MEDLLDAIVNDESPSQISDGIKDMLYSKAAERVDAFRPYAATVSYTHLTLPTIYSVEI